MFLVIHDSLKVIQCNLAILNFTVILQDVFYDEKLLLYIEHIFYRLVNSKITFEQYWSINSKQYQPTFNNFKFYIICHFI